MRTTAARRRRGRVMMNIGIRDEVGASNNANDAPDSRFPSAHHHAPGSVLHRTRSGRITGPSEPRFDVHVRPESLPWKEPACDVEADQPVHERGPDTDTTRRPAGMAEHVGR